ncbi:PREDICTED: U-box domain-containing protein 21-like isoform X3 [Tarenaya hassleriana]|uniref:U-box domain-containing protein 21-like isoform X1 n=1 Tax=Tarenaya hassleriana TaxID=28532 RepID=UPI00053C2061|nr:PREDICTED: U-box domain-containing protein 21-like isoform X1 [Tarenaya hassleriana]XP_019059374.1 PREDICTED: U-box domain-containing protein 21-like isoform X2 [Tarenaya hassleriana]XP_019059375.1 PREDICTED: U-box domain-containing protein 21-like isoform X3 [Tarenaya hassleriana]
MVFPLRLRRRGGNKKEIIPVMCDSEIEIMIPAQFRCPISFDLMKDPVIMASGITYDRESIEKWIESGNKTCPVTNTVLKTFEQIPNHAIRKVIQDWCVEMGSNSGIQRIPTPRVPVTPQDASEICGKLLAAARRGDHQKCGEVVGKIKNLGKESERNKKCLRENGVGLALCVCFDAFVCSENAFLLEEVLSVLTWMFPIGSEGQTKITSAASLRCLAGFLRSMDDSVRRNAAFLLKELLASDETHVVTLAGVDGVAEAFVKLIRDALCVSSTKSSLTAIYHMISNNPKMVSKFLETGLVNLAVEIIVDAEKSLCEKALAVLDAICETREGKEEIGKNALVMPLLVKKMPKISELATMSSVSVIWKLCKTENAATAIEEAVRMGAFQKLLVVLQVGCRGGTKEKATELLKMMNPHVGKLEVGCVDSSMDFKYLKKPF